MLISHGVALRSYGSRSVSRMKVWHGRVRVDASLGECIAGRRAVEFCYCFNTHKGSSFLPNLGLSRFSFFRFVWRLDFVLTQGKRYAIDDGTIQPTGIPYFRVNFLGSELVRLG